MDGGESGLRSGIRQALLHHALNVTIEVDILDSAAADADQMVMVPQQRLGQLEVGVIASGADAANDPAANQHIQIAVRRALGQFRISGHDVGQRHGLPSPGQHFNKLSPAAGVAVILPSQPGADLGVDLSEIVPVIRRGEGLGSHLISSISPDCCEWHPFPNIVMGVRTITDTKKMGGRAVCIMAALALIVSGCGNDEGTDRGGVPVVMAITTIWADVVANVACDGLADVVTLIPPGGDPHAYQPSLKDRGRMEDAAMIVANGLGLEEGLEDTLDAVDRTGTPVFHMADHVETIGFDPGMEMEDHGEEGEEAEEGEDHGHGEEDPHIWFDPIRVAGALPALGEAMASEAGLDADALNACLTDYQGELIDLDAEIDEILAPLPHEDRLMVTDHDALGYFVDRYGFQLVGTVIPGGSSLGSANPAELQELIQLIDQTGVAAIFAEFSHSSKDAEALGREAGVPVVTLDTGSLGPPTSRSGTYIGFLRTNAAKIADGLG